MTTNLPMGGFPAVDRKVGITISGLEQWKDGIVSGATVKVEIIQHGHVIHSEVFSGKASAQFTRVVVIKATYGDLIAVHNRPDLPGLKVSADFITEQKPFVIKDGQVLINDAVIAGTKTYKLNACVRYDSDKATTSDDKIREIVSRYMTGGATEYTDELVEELKSLVEKENYSARLATIISEQVRERLKKEMQPGGLLHGR